VKQSRPDTADPRLARFRAIAQLLDHSFRVPGTNWRFGLDPIMGLFPGVGDLMGAVLGLYGVQLARRLGAPPSVQSRMLLNLAVDALFGAVPVLGDLFDFAFKAHLRNRLLLERWLAEPRAVRRGSQAQLAAVAVLLFASLAGAVYLAVLGVRWLLSLAA
jgi:hypothetical protein